MPGEPSFAKRNGSRDTDGSPSLKFLDLDKIIALECTAPADSLLAGWLEGTSEEKSEPSACGSELEVVVYGSNAGSSGTSSTADLSQRTCSDTGSIDRQDTGLFCQRDSHSCITSDGWRLHLQHVYDPVIEAATSYNSPARQFPVLLVPGLASSGEHTFDLLPECSLVELLVSLGYDVWLADLRGNGQSQKPNPLDSSTWWTVDDHFYKDVPAVMQYVLSHNGAKQLHWIGHSMGGMLAIGLLSQQGKLAGALRSVTLVASGCFGAGSWHSILRPVILSVTTFGFPAGLVCSAIGSLSSFTRVLWFMYLIQGLFYCPSNTPVKAARRLMANCFRFIPTGVIQQFMGSLNSKQGLCSQDHTFKYADPQALRDCQVPVQALNGSWDMFCPAAGGRKTVELVGSQHKRFVCLGPWQGTTRHRYGHFDIMCGQDVHLEVFPYITDWLEQHDAPL